MRYAIEAEFTTDYLQAKFDENAKASLKQNITVRGQQVEANSPDVFVHKDNGGCYIPAEQIEGSLANASKDFKIKSSKKSLHTFVKALLTVYPRRIYFEKDTYDDIEVSYPKRKDGSRVTIAHPLFRKGTKFSFEIECIDDKIIDGGKILDMLRTAGMIYCLGARRPKYGKFKVTSFKELYESD